MSIAKPAPPACRRCGAPVKKAGRMFCSTACRGAARRTSVERTCRRCRSRFAVPPSRVAREGGQYCRRECADAGRRKYDWPPTVRCARCGTSFPTSGRSREARFCTPRCFRLSRRKLPVVRVCARCGDRREFRSGTRIGRFCSPRCAARARAAARPRIERPCDRCGRSFATTPTELRRGRRFCTRACYVGPDGGMRDVDCLLCGTTRRVYARVLAAGHGKFCTRDCWYRWRARQSRLDLPCAQCRKPFTVPRSQAGRKFCGRRCYRRRIAPRSFRCRACRSTFKGRKWRDPKFCSPACAYRGRRRRRPSPDLANRNRRILELHAEGLKAPAIRRRLFDERPEWWESAVNIRQVVSRARRRGPKYRGTRQGVRGAGRSGRQG